MLGSTGDVVWGFLSLQTEERPVTLPTGASSRAYLRVWALRSGYPPDSYFAPLFSAAVDLLSRDGPLQVITYGGEQWAVNALLAAGFSVTDQVQFFELRRPQQPALALLPAQYPAVLLPAQSEHLERLAELDAAAFPPLWHFGYKDMLELMMRARVQIALQNDELVGYSAAIANAEDELQLARLAVRPDRQGQGFGRQLLHDVIEHAAARRVRKIILNTQVDNERSQRLYRAYGFRPTSKPTPVLAIQIGELQPTQLRAES